MAVHSDRKNKISFAKLEEILNSKNKTWGYLREQGISPGIVAKMKDGTGAVSYTHLDVYKRQASG